MIIRNFSITKPQKRGIVPHPILLLILIILLAIYSTKLFAGETDYQKQLKDLIQNLEQCKAELMMKDADTIIEKKVVDNLDKLTKSLTINATRLRDQRDKNYDTAMKSLNGLTSILDTAYVTFGCIFGILSLIFTLFGLHVISKWYKINKWYSEAKKDIQLQQEGLERLPDISNGVINFNLKEYNLSIEFLEKHKEKNYVAACTYSKANFCLGRQELGPSLSNDYLQTALKSSNKAIEIEKKAYPAYLIRGDIYKSLENYKEALKDYKLAKKLSPPDIESLNSAISNRIAYAYLYKKDYEPAIREFEEIIIRSTVFNSSAHCGLGKAFLFTGNIKEANKELCKVIKKAKVLRGRETVWDHFSLAYALVICKGDDSKDEILTAIKKALQGLLKNEFETSEQIREYERLKKFKIKDKIKWSSEVLDEIIETIKGH